MIFQIQVNKNASQNVSGTENNSDSITKTILSNNWMTMVSQFSPTIILIYLVLVKLYELESSIIKKALFRKLNTHLNNRNKANRKII